MAKIHGTSGKYTTLIEGNKSHKRGKTDDVG